MFNDSCGTCRGTNTVYDRSGFYLCPDCDLPKRDAAPEAPPTSTAEQSEALHLLLQMTEEQRRLLLSAFCRDCLRHLAPNESCHCENDE